MTKVLVTISKPDPNIGETNYAYDITLDGELIVQIRKRYLGDAVAKALAQKLHDFLSGTSAVERGIVGGMARAASLSGERRTEIASKAAKARWSKRGN